MRSRPEASEDLAPALAAAVDRVRAGGLIAYPTETVFGLGADASSADAVARLRAWKGRGADQPLSVLVPDASFLVELGQDATSLAGRLAARFWP
ncbi:MAG: threonylcarbamoyl-AMP synthase, partial [Myxococcales bacterium]|nr:threonylcarbamoyl-AMP synthase [Myxococcales bacterium]